MLVILPSSLQVNFDNLVGVNARSSIRTDRHGGLFYDPLTGDMTSTVHDKAQVRLYINDVPASCTGDCSFEWSSGVTPAVSSVSPSSGKESSMLFD